MKKLFGVSLLLLSFSQLIAQDYKSFPMWNPGLPMEHRVKDLVSRLTLEERVSISIGCGQPGVVNKTTRNVITKSVQLL